MKILVFLGNDAANLSIESIVKELIKRHQVRIVVQDKQAQQLQMFSNEKDIVLLEKFTKVDEDWADCAFCTVMSASRLRNFSKYIFCFCHMNPRFDLPRGYDFVFTLGELGKQRTPIHFASMPVGLAKNDIPKTSETKKQILYIDAGHFPFGKNGQRQIAEMLIKICEDFPDYNVCVKPRWFPNATDKDMSNQNFGHVYNEIEKLCPNGLPSNLELLQEYRNLQVLVDESECAISSCTSAYLDVAMRGKPLLLIKGIDNEDMYHLRNAYFENLYEFAEECGCVVDYREVSRYLPQGLVCNTEHIKKSFAYENGAVFRVIEAMEYIYECFISKGLYPDIKEYDYESYKDDMCAKTNLKMEDLLGYRHFCATETALVLTYKISEEIDWSAFYEKQLELCRKASKSKLSIIREMSFARLNRDISLLKCQYIAENREFIKNDVDESYLYYALYELGKYMELFELYSQNIDHDSLNLYVANIYWDLGKKKKAIELYKDYLVKSMERTYPKYITDKFMDRAMAFNKVLTFLYKNKELDELYKYMKYFVLFKKRHPRGFYFVSENVEKNISKTLVENGYVLEKEQRKEKTKPVKTNQEKSNKLVLVMRKGIKLLKFVISKSYKVIIELERMIIERKNFYTFKKQLKK